MKLVDQHNRIIDYLRIGVTDKCNLRCRYCMPEEGIDFSKRADILSYEEIIRLSKIFKSFGVDKVRLTGGEPFLRKDIDKLLIQLTQIFTNVHITTNATLLNDYLPTIKKIGIASMNISLDTLDKDKFYKITRRDQFDVVIDSVFKCKILAIPIKINIVVMKGINDLEIVDFLRWGMKNNIEVRFIEAMPFNEFDGNKNLFLSATDILSIIRSSIDNVDFLPSNISSSSQKYIVAGGYQFGIIPAYSRSLCESCNRIRLTPKGELLNCLYSNSGLELMPIIRNAKTTDKDIESLIIKTVFSKLKDGKEEEKLRTESVFRSMTTIGG
ncbi:MAG: GTP 3',8-cyclase MoaA [Saprospiraceae bacterium]